MHRKEYNKSFVHQQLPTNGYQYFVLLASVPFLNYFFKGIKYLRYNLNLIPPSPILNPVYIISKYGFKLCLTFISLNCMNKNEKRSFSLYFLFIFINSCFSSVQFSLITQSCPTLCNPMNHSMPGLPVHHQLQELT